MDEPPVLVRRSTFDQIVGSNQMGVRHAIQANDSMYTVTDDFTSYYQVVFIAALIDETTGAAIATTPVLTSDLPGLAVRATAGALVAGSAYVAQVFRTWRPRLTRFPSTLLRLDFEA